MAWRAAYKMRSTVLAQGHSHHKSEIPTHNPPSHTSSASARVAACAIAAILAALGLVPTANLLTHGGALPWWPLVAPLWVAGTALTLILALLVARLLGERGDRIGSRVLRLVLAPSPRTFIAVSSTATIALTMAASVYCFARQPQSIDVMAQLWHARMLLAGHLSIPTDAHPEFFSAMNVVDAGGRWYSQFPIGGPLVLASGLLFGVPWLVNPLLSAWTVRNVYRFTQRAYDEPLARGAAILLVLAPFFIFMGASEQNHVPTLTFITLALAALPAWRNANTPRRARAQAMIVGLGIGAAATIRPLDALAAAIVFGIYQLAVLRAAPERWRELALQCAAGALPIALLLWANAHTTGAPLRFGYDVMWGPHHDLGFHASPYGDPHTPRRGLMLASLYLMKLNLYLFEWPIPALVAPIVALLALRSPKSWDLLLATLIVAVLGAYALYWHNGHFLGPRFLFSVVPAFVILSARAPGLLARHLRGTPRRASQLCIPLAVFGALVFPNPAWGIATRASEYRSEQWELKQNLAAQAHAAKLTHALVFVHESWAARLMARMWAAGVARGDAERLLHYSDACALEIALDREEQHPTNDSTARLRSLESATPPAARAELHLRPELTTDPTLRFASGDAPAPVCAAQLAADRDGVSLYPPFLALNIVGRDGTVHGDVIYVRDLGARNELLRARFGDRTWYRYRPRTSPSDTTPPFARY